MVMRSIWFWAESKLSAGSEAKAHKARGALSACRILHRNKEQLCPAAITHPCICTSHILTANSAVHPSQAHYCTHAVAFHFSLCVKENKTPVHFLSPGAGKLDPYRRIISERCWLH